MSKNFELLQQAELNGSALVLEETPRVKAASYAETNENGESEHLNLVRVTEEESLKLVQTVFFLGVNAPRVVMFAAIDSGNGCSHVCASAAEVLASSVAGSVCVVDANLRKPSLPNFFGVTNHHGLTDSLRNTGHIREFAKKLRPDNLWMVSSGSLGTDSSSLLNSAPLKTRIAEIRSEFDYVLLDSPPLSMYSDGIVLGQYADGLVLVLEANATRREAAARVAESLRERGVRVLGAVLNKRTY